MQSNWVRDWSQASNVLCVRLDSIGDVIMTEPAMRALKHANPARKLTLLTSPAGAEAAQLIREIDDVMVYRAPWMKSDTEGAQHDLALVQELRNRRFDGAVIFTVYSQNPLPAALTLYLAEIPLRLAFCRENPYHLLTHWMREEEPEHVQRHEVRRQLDLVASIGCVPESESISLTVSDLHCDEAGSALTNAGINRERPWLVVHPGASAPSRRYRPDGYVEVIRRLTADAEVQVVLTGSAEEALLLEQIRQDAGLPAEAVVLSLSLGGLTALIQQAPVLLSNNTGPVHLAAGTGTPVVDLYAGTNPQHTPWQVPSRVLSREVECRWCYSSVCPRADHACLDIIEPDEIIEAVTELMTARYVAADLLKEELLT